jgi:hypothetical protein
VGRRQHADRRPPALDDYTRAHIRRSPQPGLAREVGSRGKRALAVLEAGLGN